MKSPIFLFSLPRSGSTLLQRVLMSHTKIASVAEPWLILPFVYATKREGILTEYGHTISTFAIDDFVNNLPNGEDDYFSLLGKFAYSLYEKQCNLDEVYFLDKTPRYYLIIPEIIKMFPNAKFIFLFRNPIHVMSSMMQTWSGGGFSKMYAYETDMNDGPRALSEGYILLRDKALAIQYEQFVANPMFFTQEICTYLGLDFEESMIHLFSMQNTKGRMGDSTGGHCYKSVSTASLEKWKGSFSTTYRKKIAYNYLKSIDEEVLKIQGYDKTELIANVKELKVKFSFGFGDRMALIYSLLIRYSKANVCFGKMNRKWVKGRYLF